MGVPWEERVNAYIVLLSRFHGPSTANCVPLKYKSIMEDINTLRLREALEGTYHL